ncbi:MAG: AAA-like domain-containing protein [Cyanobacteria bacterium P01_G01_bin.54]
MSACAYRVGGALPTDARTYVTRRADSLLFEKALTGQFCYVLSSRQMGKSSLRVRTIQKLREHGVACGVVDLLQICSQDIQQEQWYAAIAYHLTRKFKFDRTFKLTDYWRTVRQRTSPDQVLLHFLLHVLLPRVQGDVVLFVDEIDSVLGLNFSVEPFFGLIRQCYEQRAKQSILQRLSWVLLGVAQPEQLIRETRCNPFGLGQAIELTGFRHDECDVLLEGLRGRAARPKKVIEVILNWTGGQPFLTQKLCDLVVKRAQQQTHPLDKGQEKAVIQRLVEQSILNNWEAQDAPEHLGPIRDRLLGSPQRQQLLQLYGQILRYGEVPADQSATQTELCLSGLAGQQRLGDRYGGPVLTIGNRIYAQIFGKAWLQAQGVNLSQIRQPCPPMASDTLEQDAQLLYDHLLQSVRQEAPYEVIERFRSLFITCVGYRDSAIELALRRIIKVCPGPAAFNTILNRCCYIVVNYWNRKPTSRHLSRDLLDLFDAQSYWDFSGIDFNSTMHRLVQRFTRSEEYFALQNLVLPDKPDFDDRPAATPMANHAYRYPFLYGKYFVHANSSPEHIEEIERQQTERKWQMQRGLRRYAYALSQYSQRSPETVFQQLDRIETNPTLLTNQQLYWVLKCFVGKESQQPYTTKDLARRLIWQTAKFKQYADFKRSLYDYLTASVEARSYLDPKHLAYVQKQFKLRLHKYLETVHPDKDSQRVNETLLKQTCSQLLDFLVDTPDHREGHAQFVDLISNCNPLLLTETVMKVMLLSSHTKPAFEQRLASVFRHYDSPMLGSSEWLIPFFENVSVGLTVNFSGMDFSDLDLRL